MSALPSNEDLEDIVEDVVEDVVEDYYDDCSNLHADPATVALQVLHQQFESFIHLYNLAPRSFSNMMKTPFRDSQFKGADWLNELFLGHHQRFYDALGVEKRIFFLLCQKTIETGAYVEHQRTKVSIEECFGIFLHTIGMHEHHRNAAERFQRSPKTISRHVHIVVEALCRMAPDYITPPDFSVVPDFIKNNNQLYPFLKAGEGKQSANDSHVFAEALSVPEYNFPWPPQDSGFSNFLGFLSPYRGERYHIPEWVGANRNPSSMKELFNHRHATVRNVIERCFGSLKQRFAIIKGLMPNYKLPTQAENVIACCVVHNFVRKHSAFDEIFESVADPDYVPPPEEGTSTQPLRRQINHTDEGLMEQSVLRDSIAASLWENRHFPDTI
ncbi:hypothetical protein DH2020_007864 [Rehmannia glutinosa]|uniref:DDE Tnp4 domain-containing protein n=1 Tax=Rehmannia glutinosa TaxID=99300 RepID=A0ABR0TZC9_REHGL